MRLDEIIALFEEVEAGKEGLLIGFHLHEAIRQANQQRWPIGAWRDATFSQFIRALAAEKKPRL